MPLLFHHGPSTRRSGYAKDHKSVAVFPHSPSHSLGANASQAAEPVGADRSVGCDARRGGAHVHRRASSR